MPINNQQPSLVISRHIEEEGVFPSQESDGGTPLGTIRNFAGNFVLGDSELADGELLEIVDHIALFSIIGTLYGGDGEETFAMPDLQGRVSIGVGQGPGLDDYLLGQTAGSASITLTQNQMPGSVGGVSAPVGNIQPSLTTTHLIRVNGIFPSPDSGGGALNIIGSVIEFAGNFIPGGYLEANGQLLAIGDYEALFNLIGTTYGGDGQTTFALPDLRGRTIVGSGNGFVVGDSFGSENFQLINSQLPPDMGGAGNAVANYQPSLVLNYCIALTGIFPSQEGAYDSNTPMLGEIIAFAPGFAPRGYALAHGQLLAINQNQALFSILGTTYGGNGQTTFALPDLRGRAIVGSGPGATLGEMFGSPSFSVTSADAPPLNYSGSGADNVLYGGGQNDSINAGDGNDIIHGSLGGDTLNGGSGTDWVSYVLSTAGVNVSLLTGAGIGGHAQGDLLSNIENVLGTGYNDTLTGSSAGNILDGLAGADTLAGGAGNDTYIVDQIGDVVTELSNKGIDTVTSSVNWTLGNHLENLTLIGVAMLNGTGNGLDNVLTGNNLSNTLTGLAGSDTLDGGLGVDTLIGGAGDDLYVVTAGDATVEINNQGSDMVQSAITWSLSNYIENLTLTGAAAIDGTGNSMANTITGNSGANRLDGKAGADKLIGGLGNDTYLVDTSADVVVENVGEGTDRVLAYASYTLGANLERLDLLGSAANGKGNALNNTIVGNDYNNVINGGAGIDLLSGGAGKDAFVFDATPGAANRDRINDFNPTDDAIRLDDAVFTVLPLGALSAAAFHTGAAAHDASDRIVYDSTTGYLYYDPDGTGAAAAVHFATLNAGLAVTASDFTVI